MKNTWRTILAAAVSNPLKGFKRYKTDNNVELPQHAEFSGDKFPTKTGDPAKVELKAFKGGNAEFKSDVARERANADHGSALMSKKVKSQSKKAAVDDESDVSARPFYDSRSKRIYYDCPTCGFSGRVPIDSTDKYADWQFVSPTMLACPKCGEKIGVDDPHLDMDSSWTTSKKKTWRNVLADMSLKQKPDGTLQVDVTSTPGEPLFNNAQTGQPGPLSPDQTQQTTTPPVQTQPVQTETPAKKDAEASLKLAELGMFENWYTQHKDDESLRDEYQEYFLEAQAEDVSEIMDYEQWLQYKFAQATTGMPSMATDVKKWLIDKTGSYRLVGKECEKFAGIVITKDHREIESMRLRKDGHRWRELIPQAVWQAKLSEYASEK